MSASPRIRLRPSDELHDRKLEDDDADRVEREDDADLAAR